MIRKASFKNFRGFQHMELSDMRAITLIAGKNNSGKSSILEGIFLALNHRAPKTFIDLNKIRGLPVLMTPAILWEPLFYNLLKDEEVEIDLTLNDGELKLKYSWDDAFMPVDGSQTVLNQIISSVQLPHSLKFEFQYGEIFDTGYFIMETQGISRNGNRAKLLDTSKIVFLPIILYIHTSRGEHNNFAAELFGIAVRKKKKTQIIEILKIIDDSISDITTVVSGDRSQLYANVHDQWLPLKLAGDGLDRLLLIVSSLIAQPRSVLLIDEIESGFHHSVYDLVWKAIMTVAREHGCQIVATTHSYECLESAVNAAKDPEVQDDFCYFRLARNKRGETVAHRFSQELLAHATDNDLEVR